jgi:hypothetical protein
MILLMADLMTASPLLWVCDGDWCLLQPSPGSIGPIRRRKLSRHTSVARDEAVLANDPGQSIGHSIICRSFGQRLQGDHSAYCLCRIGCILSDHALRRHRNCSIICWVIRWVPFVAKTWKNVSSPCFCDNTSPSRTSRVVERHLGMVCL